MAASTVRHICSMLACCFSHLNGAHAVPSLCVRSRSLVRALAVDHEEYGRVQDAGLREWLGASEGDHFESKGAKRKKLTPEERKEEAAKSGRQSQAAARRGEWTPNPFGGAGDVRHATPHRSPPNTRGQPLAMTSSGPSLALPHHPMAIPRPSKAILAHTRLTSPLGSPRPTSTAVTRTGATPVADKTNMHGGSTTGGSWNEQRLAESDEKFRCRGPSCKATCGFVAGRTKGGKFVKHMLPADANGARRLCGVCDIPLNG
jgi:hypothetical protein